jgi:hypothetical protein
MGGLGLNGLLAAGAGQDSMAAEQGAQSTAGSHGDGSGATGATSQAARLQDPERVSCVVQVTQSVLQCT